MRRSVFRFITLLVFTASAGFPVRAEPLPAIGADLSRTTVSGLSSGANMATQFQVAYSSLVIGAGIVAGGPYGCARTPGSEYNPFWSVVLSWNFARAQQNCMADGWLFSTVPDPADLLAYAKWLAAQGKIDPLEGLKVDKVYLFSSLADDTVEQGVVDATAEFYRLAGLPPANIDFERHLSAAHAFLTKKGGLACGTPGSPYLNDCDIDQAKAILTHLYGPLQPAAPVVETNFRRFEQAPFVAGPGETDFDAQGVVYVPSECRGKGGCAVHIVFHGCKQGLAAVGEAFVKGSGFARWAEANRIVLLFPQLKAGRLNPDGCWDWWGYSGANFLQRDAPQMFAVRRMLAHLVQLP